MGASLQNRSTAVAGSVGQTQNGCAHARRWRVCGFNQQLQYRRKEKVTTQMILRVAAVVMVSLLGALAPVAGSSQDKQIKIPDEWTDSPEKITLPGQMETKSFYGPPNFGEDPATDSIETFRLIKLDQPVLVINERTGVESSVKELQILVDSKAAVNMKMMKDGTKVVIRGKLFFAQTGHHHTQVLIIATSIDERK